MVTTTWAATVTPDESPQPQPPSTHSWLLWSCLCGFIALALYAGVSCICGVCSLTSQCVVLGGPQHKEYLTSRTDFNLPQRRDHHFKKAWGPKSETSTDPPASSLLVQAALEERISAALSLETHVSVPWRLVQVVRVPLLPDMDEDEALLTLFANGDSLCFFLHIQRCLSSVCWLIGLLLPGFAIDLSPACSDLSFPTPGRIGNLCICQQFPATVLHDASTR